MIKKSRKFVFNRNGVEEEVQLERWVWGVIYKDGSELHQFTDNGQFHQFKEIEQDKVGLFVMYKSDDISKRFDLVVTEGMKLIHFYKKIKDWNTNQLRANIYIFGYEKKGYQHFIHILPDDRVIVSDNNEINYEAFNIT